MLQKLIGAYTFYLSSLVLFLLLFQSCQQPTSPTIDLEQLPTEAEIFAPDLISTGLYERDMAIAPDGQEIIYTLSDYKQTVRSLVRIKKSPTGWGEREIVSFSGKHHDIEPFYSVDGQQLFFASNRPMNGTINRHDFNIWVSQKTKDAWGEPIALGNHINTEKDEFYPSVSKQGNLYFTATRVNGIGKEDIFVSTFSDGQYGEPIPLDTTINTLTFEFNAYINPAENLLIFGSFGRPDDFGGGDLYYSKKDSEGNWQSAVNLGAKVNSDKLDYCPFMDVQSGNFYFTSERAEPADSTIHTVPELIHQANKVLNGMGNVYRIDGKELGIGI